jgi:hypothetical protein
LISKRARVAPEQPSQLSENMTHQPHAVREQWQLVDIEALQTQIAEIGRSREVLYMDPRVGHLMAIAVQVILSSALPPSIAFVANLCGLLTGPT